MIISLATGSGQPPRAPQADVDLDIRSLRSWIAHNDEDEPELVLRCDEGTEDEQTVTIGYGVGGSWETAIAAAEAGAICLLDYADALRRQAVQAGRQAR